MALAAQLRREGKLGTTDIRGIRTHFVPGKGWVVDAPANVKAMMAAQDAEQMKQLLQDLPMRRKVMERNYARGIEDEGVADTFRRKLANVYTPSDEAYAADLYNAQAMGLREASRDAGKRVFTQAMRTGNNSNFADIASAMATSANDAYAKAALTSKLMSRGAGQREADDRRKSLANLYNLFATRAGQLPEVNYRPQNLGEGDLKLAMSGNAQSGRDALQATMMRGGSLDYVQPNYGWANAVGGAGSALASAFRMGGAKSRYDNAGGGVTGFGSPGGYGDDELYQGGEGDYFS
jgi:hypothetical protein